MDENMQNPIVALAERLRARKDLGAAIDSATADLTPSIPAEDSEARFAALAEALATGARRLNAILGSDGVRVVRLEKPLRIRLRFRDHRIALDLDRRQQLVIVSGMGLEGSYQFIADAPSPSLLNLSKLSTDAGYRDPMTASTLLKTIAEDAQLPRPAHLDAPGPMRF